MLESLIGSLLRGAYLIPVVVGCLLAARHGSYLPLWQPQAGLIAAYGAFYLVEVQSLPVGLGMVLALGTGTLFGVVVHRLFFQRCIERAAPLTGLLHGLAVILLVSSFFALVTSGYPVSFQRARGAWQLFLPHPVADTLRTPDLVAVMSSIVVLVLVAVVVRRTRIGLEFRAACSNRALAIDYGLRVRLLDWVVPTVVAILTSFGGLVYALKFGSHPQAMLPPTIKAVAVVVALGERGGVLTAGAVVVALSAAEAAVQATPAISAFEHALAYWLLIAAVVAQFVVVPKARRWYWTRHSHSPST